jgi:alkylation response protein AidB-like acyl-CoA dehydrogenase
VSERDELRGIVRDLLAKHSRPREHEFGYDEALWERLCSEIGVSALCIPESYDGAGASLGETAVVLEELAYSLTPAPLLASAMAASALLLGGSDDQKSELLPRIAAGETATVALGPVVPEPEATIALAADLSPISVEVAESLDPLSRLGRATGVGPPAPELVAVAAALSTAGLLGVSRRALDDTVAYSLERVQFGRPIGSFQALKHRMADLLVLVEMMRSASWAATDAAAAYVGSDGAADPADLLRLASVAQTYCARSARAVTGEAIQLHGGIAITWEHDAHLMFKHAHTLGALVPRLDRLAGS